jgi:hypothetical protein
MVGEVAATRGGISRGRGKADAPEGLAEECLRGWVGTELGGETGTKQAQLEGGIGLETVAELKEGGSDLEEGLLPRGALEGLGGGREDGDEGIVTAMDDGAAELRSEASHPRLDGPDGVDLASGEELEELRVGHGDDLGVAAAESHLKASGGEPGAGVDILGIAKLGRAESAALEIGRTLGSETRPGDDGVAAVDDGQEETKSLTFGADVAGEKGRGADEGGVDGPSEEGLDGGGASVVGEPLDL